MADIEFNLLDEPWIQVMDFDGNVREVSLIESLEDAHKYRRLAGESPQQDIPILRLQEAVIHATVGHKVHTRKDATNEWGTMWRARRFPMDEIRAYLDKYHDRFYLFHPEYPFYQRPCAVQGTSYPAEKLNGCFLQSGNVAKNPRFFTERSPGGYSRMGYAEAARWLPYTNGFDDTSAKPSAALRASKKAAAKNNPAPAKKGTRGQDDSVGAGWLGKCGLVYFRGDTLFETLMLNLVLWDCDRNEPYGEERPCWELDQPHDGERVRISPPDNLSELYTLQSRRILLQREGGYVTGFSLLGGDFFDPVDAFIEPMTIWRKDPADKSGVRMKPCRHDPEKFFWQSFPGLLSIDCHRPGVLRWVDRLLSAHVLENRPIRLCMAAVSYADKDFYVKDMLSDLAEVDAEVLFDLNKAWAGVVTKSVGLTDKAASLVWKLARRAGVASGMEYKPSGRSEAGDYAKSWAAKLYQAADGPFRVWLRDIRADEDSCTEKENEWLDELVRLSKELGGELMRGLPPQALFGRPGGDGSAAGAMSSFIYGLEAMRRGS